MPWGRQNSSLHLTSHQVISRWSMTNTRQHSASQWGCLRPTECPLDCRTTFTFQRLMTCCFRDLYFTHLLIYLDDLIIVSKTFDEHLERLQLVFNWFQEHGLKLKPSKCQLMRQEVQYLGHLVSAEGVWTDPEKISRVKD